VIDKTVSPNLIGRIRANENASDLPTRSGSRWLLLTNALGTTLAPLNSTMIAVALPDVQRDFAASVTTTAWLVSLYLVTMAIVQPIGGRLGDLFGRRRLYLWGLTGFAIASIGCAFAPNLALLIVCRTGQALTGALTVPNGTAIVRESVPSERRGSAFGTIGLATGLAAALGPPLGGLLVHLFGWQAIFWANVPVVITTALLGIRQLPHPDLAARTVSRPNRGSFDLAGSGLLALALSGLLIVPTFLKLDRSELAVAAGIGGLLVGALFLWWERRNRSPVVDIRLFGARDFSAACASIYLSNLVMYTSLLALPLYLEDVRGHDARVTGLVLAVLSGLAALAGPFGGRFADRRGRRLPAIAGAVALCVGATFQAIAAGDTRLWLLAIALGLMGLGLGIQGAPVQTAVIEASPPAKTGAAAGVYSTSRYLGSVTGASVLAIVLAQKPNLGEDERFAWLFAGLAIAAALGILVNGMLSDQRDSTRS
jgi:EmrB/QacA subfamily drug resistance transporter